MTRVFLAAGVAALAIAAPAAAGPHGGGGHGNGGGAPAYVNQGGGGGQARGQGGGGGGHHGGGGNAFRMQSFNGSGHGNGGGGGGGFRMQAYGGGGHGNGHGAYAMRAQQQERQQARGNFARMQQRMAVREPGHGNNHAQAQNRLAFRQQAERNHGQAFNHQQLRMQQQMKHMHGNGMNQMAERQQQMRRVHGNAMNRMVERQQLQADRVNGEARVFAENARGGVGYGVGGCPPGLAGKGCMPPGLARQETLQALRSADAQVFRNSSLNYLAPSILAPVQAARYVGSPLSVLGSSVPLMALPSSVSYLYPDTPDYYYRYGDGYLYQVNRSNSLVDSLIPLLAGGYLPGTYLPQPYMSSYVPDYYGLSSFYPASYGRDYGYGYGGYNYDNLCNRYADGVIYQVDCYSGMVENVIPMYAGGYGVGQMIPSAYSYYNVPMQYRDMYYPTADYSYWYAPGAIYQYDTNTSLITSVAALMSPGFSVGQPLPAGYGVYNVPYAYRSTYYDTPNAWYRYNNGYIYQVDPATQLVTAIVASLLT